MRLVNLEDLAPDFELPDLEGRLVSLGHHRGRIVIVNFWSCECPHVERTDRLLMTWHQRWGRQVSLLPVASNAMETLDAMVAAARKRQLPRVLVDQQHRIADVYEASTTPHVFVVDAMGRVRYRGAVDDTSFARRVPTRFFLEEAVDSLLEGRTPRVAETQPYGCAIVRDALE